MFSGVAFSTSAASTNNPMAFVARHEPRTKVEWPEAAWMSCWEFDGDATIAEPDDVDARPYPGSA